MQLTDFQKDTLIEVANIAFGNASKALGELLKQRVEAVVPTLSIETVEAASDTIGSADEQMTEILVKITGDVSGIALIFLKPEMATSLNQLVNKVNGISALPEIGNILAGNALSALSHFLKITVAQSIPDIATDMRRALVVSSVFFLGEETDQVLLLGTTFSIPVLSLSADMYFLFDEKSAQRIIGVL